ncbi:MAG: hypothetical protein J7M29_02780 [Verrucomicrobia bacterium]|nr:hypothetical protein [Verrucomicrobiota bacterium]
MPELIGNYTVAVDPSYRLMLPAEWRTSEHRKRLFPIYVAPWPPTSKCPPEQRRLLLIPKPRWDEASARLRSANLLNPAEWRLRRALFGNSRRLDLDKVGRVCLGKQLVEEAGIKDRAVVIGVQTAIEAWAPERLEASKLEEELSVEELAQLGDQLYI